MNLEAETDLNFVPLDRNTSAQDISIHRYMHDTLNNA